MMNGRDECNEKNEDLRGMKTLEQMDWWKEIKEEESCTLETILYEMMSENGHEGLRNKTKSGGWRKGGRQSDEGSLAFAQQSTQPALLSCFYLTLFFPAFCSPEISEWAGETECARKLQ